jgi:hypothetical protein
MRASGTPSRNLVRLLIGCTSFRIHRQLFRRHLRSVDLSRHASTSKNCTSSTNQPICGLTTPPQHLATHLLAHLLMVLTQPIRISESWRLPQPDQWTPSTGSHLRLTKLRLLWMTQIATISSYRATSFPLSLEISVLRIRSRRVPN